MAGVASHQPSHDRQDDWMPLKVDEWARRTHPLVVNFAGHVITHLDTIQLDHNARTKTLGTPRCPIADARTCRGQRVTRRGAGGTAVWKTGVVGMRPT